MDGGNAARIFAPAKSAFLPRGQGHMMHSLNTRSAGGLE
jgi:hypothetical protein